MNGAAHYAKAEEILTEIEAVPPISNETETALSVRALAHAMLATAAAVAVGDSVLERGPWMDIAGGRFT